MSSTPPPFAPPSGSSIPNPPRNELTPPTNKLTGATMAGQIVAFLVCAFAAGLLAAWAGAPAVFVGAVVALGGGVAAGLGTGVGLRFTNVAGWVVAAAATLVTVMVLGVIGAYTQLHLPIAIALLVGLFVVGLDWCYVQRLRGAVVLSGVLVVPLLAADKGWETAAALVWFGGALVAFWFLERDGRSAVPVPEPVAGGPPPPPSTSVSDLLGVIGMALLIGFVAAMLIGNPSCSTSSSAPKSLPGGGSQGGSSGQSQSQGQGQAQSRGQAGGQSQSPSSLANGEAGGQGGSAAGAAPLYRLDRDGLEQQVGGGEFGGGTITDSSGQRFSTSTEDGQTVVRDSDGQVVARLDGDEVIAGPPGGDTQHYQIDDQGRVFVLGVDGRRYYLDERDGKVVLVDPAGDVVASAPIASDHLYVRDPDGNVLVPGSGADGDVPIPNQAVREGLLGQGKTYSTTGSGDPQVTGADGSTRVYGTDDQGRPQVKVDDGQGQIRTFVYDQSGGQLRVLELDQDGKEINRFLVDPTGSFVEGRAASGDGQPTAESASGRAGAPTEVAHDKGTNWGLIALLAMAVALVIGVVAWWWLHAKPPAEPSWAEAIVRRLDREGASRGRARGLDETVPTYTAVLAGDVLPDPRLTTIGRVASDALFGRSEPSDELRSWADATLTEIVDSHPVPHWTDRFRRAAPRPADT